MNYGNRNKSFRKRVLVFSLLGAVVLLLLLGAVLNAVGSSGEEHKTSQVLFEDADTGTKFKYEFDTNRFIHEFGAEKSAPGMHGTPSVCIISENSTRCLNSVESDISLTTSNGKRYVVCGTAYAPDLPTHISWIDFRKLPSKFEDITNKLKEILGLAIIPHLPPDNIDWETMMEQCSWAKIEGKVSGELARKYCLSSPITVELKPGVSVPIDSYSLTVSELVTSDNTTSVVFRTEDLEIDEIELYDMSWNKINSSFFRAWGSKNPNSTGTKSYHYKLDKEYSRIQIVITRKEVVNKFYVPINLKLDKDGKVIPE